MARPHDATKRHGVHYTPPVLASFLARATYAAVADKGEWLDVLDPACGDGGLLSALAEVAPEEQRQHLRLFAFEQDHAAAAMARSSLGQLPVGEVDIQERDFLDVEGVEQRDTERRSTKKFDVVIANPPYVRTQVLGAKRAQALGKKFGLSGRVDLYHAFSIAMANVMREGGVLGLLTSNRFLTIKSGIALRRFLRREFELLSVFDLGDTKLFRAAVLPVIVVARKRGDAAADRPCRFSRVYQHRSANGFSAAEIKDFGHVLDAVEQKAFSGLARTATGLYDVENGVLDASGTDEVWSLSTPEQDQWMNTVARHRRYTFDDVAKIRVGIKTTADAVFIRDDWQSEPQETRPEGALTHPLITHHDAGRWVSGSSAYHKSVLYPHECKNGKRTPICLAEYPRAARYFESHAERLKSRTYVTKGGRQWYEIWVPHNPADWASKKVVFPDISERPTFFLDESGAIVNGDCYWITLKPGFADEWLYLLLAVANSSFAEKFYDVAFHNQLYAGRRRYMTQYVKQFPLPDLATPLAEEIVDTVAKLVGDNEREEHERLEMRVDELVWEAFRI